MGITWLARFLNKSFLLQQRAPSGDRGERKTHPLIILLRPCFALLKKRKREGGEREGSLDRSTLLSVSVYDR